MKQYLSLFRNVKFNIGVFALLAIGAITGTLLPQLHENPEGVERFMAANPQWGPLLQKAEAFNIYYSWWFIGLLGLLAFDVVVCKLIFGKFPGFRTFKKPELNAAVVGSQPLKAEWLSELAPDAAGTQVAAVLRERKYALRKLSAEHQSGWVAAKHRLQRFGSWVSHVSILLVLLANLTGALYGFRENLNVPEGTSARMEHRPWVVSCDKFIVDWYPNSDTPKTFASDLRLFDQGRLAREQKILVNEPLEHKKVRFYQATYGPHLKEARIGFFLRQTPKKSPTLTLRLGEEAAVPGTPYSLRILQFVPDFSMNERREVSSRSVQPHNPALQILVSKDGKPLKAPWVFEKFPGMMMPPVQQDDNFILVLADYVPAYYTGLQVAYDPGADLFWLACAILVAGLMVLFYLHHRKVWVVADRDSASGRTRVRLGGFSSRGKSFEDEFARLVDDCKLRTRVAAKPGDA